MILYIVLTVLAIIFGVYLMGVVHSYITSSIKMKPKRNSPNFGDFRVRMIFVLFPTGLPVLPKDFSLEDWGTQKSNRKLFGRLRFVKCKMKWNCSATVVESYGLWNTGYSWRKVAWEEEPVEGLHKKEIQASFFEQCDENGDLIETAKISHRRVFDKFAWVECK